MVRIPMIFVSLALFFVLFPQPEKRKTIGWRIPPNNLEQKYDTLQDSNSFGSSEDELEDLRHSPAPRSPRRSVSPVLNSSEEVIDEEQLTPQEIYRESSGLPWAALVVFVVVVVAVLGRFVGDSTGSKLMTKNCSILLDLSQKFPQQEDFFWRTIKVSVESVLRDEPPQPSVIVFVYNRNAGEAQKLISHISSTITSCFESNPQPLVLSAKDFNRADMIKDFGVAISAYREQLKQSIVMFVHEIQKIPPKVVEAFHTFCDKQSPLVEQSIILFSLELENTKTEDRAALYDVVEERLTEQWKNSVPVNKIQPLLARMTETVLFLETK